MVRSSTAAEIAVQGHRSRRTGDPPATAASLGTFDHGVGTFRRRGWVHDRALCGWMTLVRFNSIVTALDLHAAADRALVHVAGLARAGALPVELVAVCPRDARPVPVTIELERRVAQFDLSRAEVFVICDDAPGSVIVDHVTARDGALLVIATTGHGGDETRLGPVTDEVLRRVRQPVLVVGPRAEPTTGGLLLAVDASGAAKAALPGVERWLGTFGNGTPLVAEVLPPDPWPAADDVGPIGSVDRYVGLLAERRIESSGEVLRAFDPAAALAACAARCHASVLVVTSPPDPGQPSHWYDTTRRLVRTAHCPVLVVPAT